MSKGNKNAWLSLLRMKEDYLQHITHLAHWIFSNTWECNEAVSEKKWTVQKKMDIAKSYFRFWFVFVYAGMVSWFRSWPFQWSLEFMKTLLVGTSRCSLTLEQRKHLVLHLVSAAWPLGTLTHWSRVCRDSEVRHWWVHLTYSSQAHFEHCFPSAVFRPSPPGLGPHCGPPH